MHEKWISRLIAFALAFTFALAGVGCLVTGFTLNADLGIVVFNIFVAAILIVTANCFRWGNLIVAGVLAVFLNHLWYSGDLEQSMEGLLFWISMRFDGAYGWGVVFWSGEAPEFAQLETALSVVAIPVIWAVAWTILKRVPAILAVPVSILMPAVCFVITNSVPAGWCLFLLCLALLLLMLTQTVRRRSAVDGNRLTALLLIPALLCTSLLFWAVPQEGYSPRFDTPQWLQGWFSGGGLGVGAGSNPGDTVDLSTVGPKWQARLEVMQVSSDRKGVIYLRGQAYDQYDGTSWAISDVDTTKDQYWPTQNMTPDGTITIKTKTAKRIRYVPYYPQNGALLSQIRYGKLEGEATKEYSYSITDRVGIENINISIKRDAIVSECLKLPESTSEAAKVILRNLSGFGSDTEWQWAQRIGKYLSKLKPYDINTGKMPDGYEDFAIWFMTEAETGYCVHFATAAVVLLRAAGVPARYVTGYMVDVGEGFAIVEERHAHAWVEYLDRDRGWTVLDPTPSVDEPEPTEPTNPTDTTAPTESTEPTNPTDPSLPTTPTDPTQSTEPTAPTQPVESTVPEATEPNGAPVDAWIDWSGLWNILQYVLPALAVIGLVAGQYFLRIGLRKKKRRKLTTNEKALQDWKEITRLSRLLKQPVAEELEELAEKARFSQYTLSGAEIDIFRGRITELKEILQKKNWISRFVLKLVFAIE